jgi:hypothetical protein
MALANDLVLDDVSGDDVTYRLASQDAGGSRRIDVATTLQNPGLLVIKHSTTGKGSAMVDRHLVSISRTLATTTGPQTCTVNFTMAIPRAVEVTPTIVKDAVVNLVDLLVDGQITSVATTATLDALMRGES